MQSASNVMKKKMNLLAGVVKRKKVVVVLVALAGAAAAGYFAWGGAKKAAGNYLTDSVKRGTITSIISASGMVEPVSTVSLSFKNSEVIKNIYVKAGDRVTAGQLLAEQDSENLEAQVNQALASLKGAASKLELLQNGPRREEIAQAEANAAMARAAYESAQANLDRYQKLAQEGAVSQADLEKARLDFANAEGKLKQAEESLKTLQAGNRPEDINSASAQVESSKAQLQMAYNDLSGARMVSPIDGIVSAVNGAVGQRATANNNNTSGGSGFIVIISDALQVKAQVNEADIGRTEVGQKVEFTVNSFPNKTFAGKVDSISPQAYTVSNVQIYDVIIRPDENYKELKAGMPANVNIIIDRHENALTIPKGAVTYAVSYLNKMRQSGGLNLEGADGRSGNQQQNRQRNSGEGGTGPGNGGNSGPASATKESNQEQQAMVLVLDKSGNPAPRRVVLGLSDLRNYEVVRGLNEGDTVVVGSLTQPAAAGAQAGQGGGNPPFMSTPRATGGGTRR